MKVTRIAAAVLTVLALPAAEPAEATGGRYTYMLCANPDTGRGTTASDGVFPDGVTMSAGHPNMSTLQSRQACSGQSNAASGMMIRPQGGYRLEQQQGTTFNFSVPSQLRFVDAHLWRRMNTENGMTTSFVRSASDWIYASPNFDRCEEPGWGCRGRGSHDPFSSGNYVYVGTAHEGMERGFKWFLRCAAMACNVTDNQQLQIYGGKVGMADDNGPSASLGVGGLGSDTVLRGVERVSFSAADGQTGVFRARLFVDGAAQPWFSVDGGNPTCRDANPANADDYEFTRLRPCPGNVDASAELNTAALRDGEHNVRLIVEDASGRMATVLDRDVEVDNIGAPSAATDPSVGGVAIDGRELVATLASWDDQGAEGDPVVTARWEGCEGASDCSDLGPAGSPLVLDDSEVGLRVRVVETAVNAEGTTVARSAFTDVVTDTPAPSNTGVPAISGNPRRGNLLVASAGAWDAHGSPDAPVVARRWQRCGVECVDIAGATGATYELGDADLNRRLRVVESASNEEGSASVVSAATGRVTREDGTLPPDNNGVDDDGDGQVDEPGEQGGGGDDGGGGGGTGTNGAAGTPGAPGAPGVSSTTSSSTSVKVSRSTTLVAPNGNGASASARLVVAWRDARGAALTVGYGKGAVAHGRLVDEAGRPIGGAVIEVAAVTSVRGAVPRPRPSVTTGEDGRFTFAADRRSSSETVRFSYAHERGGKPVAIDELELRVTARVRLSVSLRGVAVSYKGTVAGGPMPRGGKLVIVQGRVKGKAWQTFASRRARAGGRFSGKYRLKLRVPGRKLQFRARVVAESGYPYLGAVSRAVTKTVR